MFRDNLLCLLQINWTNSGCCSATVATYQAAKEVAAKRLPQVGCCIGFEPAIRTGRKVYIRGEEEKKAKKDSRDVKNQRFHNSSYAIRRITTRTKKARPKVALPQPLTKKNPKDGEKESKKPRKEGL